MTKAKISKKLMGTGLNSVFLGDIRNPLPENLAFRDNSVMIGIVNGLGDISCPICSNKQGYSFGEESMSKKILECPNCKHIIEECVDTYIVNIN